MAKSPGSGRRKRAAAGQLVPQVAYFIMGAESLATASAQETGAIDFTGATSTITVLPLDWEHVSGLLAQIAADIQSLVPLLRALIEAQRKVGGNAKAVTALLPPDAARIAELTAGALSEQAKSSDPNMRVVEQCLRAGRWLLLGMMEVIAAVIVAVDGDLIYEALTDPEKARLHTQHIVTMIDHILPKMFGS